MGTEALLAMIIPALMPALTDGVKGLAQKLFGGTKPVNVDDQVKLMTAEVSKLQALAALDAPAGNISQWVADFRASFRYFAAACIILGTLFFVLLYFWFTFTDPQNAALDNLVPVLDVFSQMSASVFAFMFGDRMYLNLKTARKG
jgi:hypothetical protein